MTYRQASGGAALDKVLVAGGGIGGLATALALAKHGIASVVLERRLVFGEDGAGIQIGPNGTRVLEYLGAAPFLRARVTAPDALRILEAARARELGHFPLGRWIALRHGAPYWVAHRRDLHSALLKAVENEPLVRLRMGFSVTAARDDGDTVTATSAEGDLARGDVLIAADGVWSALRARAFAGTPLVPTGKSAVRAVIPIDDVPEPLHRTEVHLWLGPDVHVVHYPVSAGHAMALVAVFDDGEVATDWSAPCDPGWVAARTRTFAPLLRDLLARPEQWRRWSLMRLTRHPRVSVGRTALLGDAAHPVLPFLAQGGVMALEDAVVVAHALATDAGNPARALDTYARARARRVRRVAEASRRNGRIFHMDGVMARARDFALGHIPPARFMSRYDWLYGWSPPHTASR